MEEQDPADEEPKRIPPPKLGAVLGPYKLVELLGSGGMGRVYVGQHQRLGRKVALKVLLPEFASRPEIVQRFFNEARAVNQINHPNIVEIVDFVEDPKGWNYFIMELLEGRTLTAVRDEEGPFLLGRAVAVAQQVASALAAAHAQGIVHRDIKPDNVVLLPGDERPNFVKLLDFGIAKLTSGVSEAQKTRLGLVLGTPGYMSPEQALGRPVDGRSDIYSLGVLLHWMLVDELPLVMPAKPGPPQLLWKTAQGQPIPTPLGQLVERCLRFDPDDRVQTMTRVRDELVGLAPTVIGDADPTAPTVLEPRLAAARVVESSEDATRLKPAPPVARAIDLRAEGTPPEPVGGGPLTMQAQIAAFPKRSGARWLGVAAAVLLAAGIGLYVVLRQEEPPVPDLVQLPPPPAAAPKPAAPIMPAPSPPAVAQLPPPPAAIPPPAAAPAAPLPAAVETQAPSPPARHAKAGAGKRGRHRSSADETTIIDPLKE